MAGKTRKVCKWELTNQILYHSPVKHDAVTSLGHSSVHCMVAFCQSVLLKRDDDDDDAFYTRS